MLASLSLASIVAFSNLTKAVHIDDALYLSIAERILEAPLDPYGGTIHWQDRPGPAYEVSISPPLLSYQHAAILALFGHDDLALHAGMVPWVLLAGWSLHRLGERFAGKGRGLPVAGSVLLAPAFVVGLNLMLDAPMLAAVLASIDWLTVSERPKSRELLIAGLFAAVAISIKYPAMALWPIFGVVAWNRRSWGPLLAISIPLTAFLAWQWYAALLYGDSQVGQGMGFLSQFRDPSVLGVWGERILEGLAILATTSPIALLALALGRWNRWTLGTALVAGVAAWCTPIGAPVLEPTPLVHGMFSVAVAMGAFGVANAIRGGWRRIEAPDVDEASVWLLAVWIGAFVGFVVPLSPFVATRSFLPLVPPLTILLFRWPVEWLPRHRVGVVVSLTTLAIGAGCLAWTDHRWANAYRTEARRLAERFESSGSPVYFFGHWGWQYYCEREGFRPWQIDWRRPPDVRESFVVIPIRVDKQAVGAATFLLEISDRPWARGWFGLPVDSVTGPKARLLFETVVPAPPIGLTTWNLRSRISFYGGEGVLPWGFSDEATEVFLVAELRPGLR